MLLDPSAVVAGLICISDEVERWNQNQEQERKGGPGCSIDVLVVPTALSNNDNSDNKENNKDTHPTTTDGRPIPALSVNAHRIYWALRGDPRPVHMKLVADMVGGMSDEEVQAAGNELLDHCLVSTSEEDYDVWTLGEI